MDIHTFLEKLFEGYVVCYRKFGWHTTSGYADMTQVELQHFADLGESLGYISRREMNWEYPRDLCWVDANQKDVFLYIERENKDDRYRHTMNKMFNSENTKDIPGLLALFGWLRQETYEQAKKEIKSLLPPGKSMLLIAWVGESQECDNFSVNAFCMSPNRITERHAIPKIDKSGYWYLYFDPDSKWL